MTVLLVAIACGLATGGVVLGARGLLGVTSPLEDVVADLHRPRRGDIVVRDGWGWLAGRPSPAIAADLAATDKNTGDWVRDRCTWSLLAATPGLVATMLSASGVVQVVSPVMALGFVAAGHQLGEHLLQPRLEVAPSSLETLGDLG